MQKDQFQEIQGSIPEHQTLGSLIRKVRTMTDDFEKRMNALEDMTKALAEVQYENLTVIAEYKRVMELMGNIRKKAEKKFGGEIASEAVVEKKVNDYVEQLWTENKAKPKSKQNNPKRLTGLMKLKVLMAMLKWFDEKEVKTITLEDIENWTKPSKDGSKQQVLREMGVGNINVKSTQFFQTKINDSFVRLYPDNAYVTKSAPFKSHFVVKTWNKWLKDNESKLAEGKQGSGVKS